jgi:hypothetical protein
MSRVMRKWSYGDCKQFGTRSAYKYARAVWSGHILLDENRIAHYKYKKANSMWYRQTASMCTSIWIHTGRNRHRTFSAWRGSNEKRRRKETGSKVALCPFGSLLLFYIYKAQKDSFKCLRPYHVENTGSRPITEVKQRRARLVLGWVTAWEYRVQ